METSITISGDLLDRIAKAIPSGSGVTITCQNGLIQYHAADGAAPPVSVQSATHDEFKKLHAKIAEFTRWKHCMSYNDNYFGEPEGLLKRIAYELDRMTHSPPEKSRVAVGADAAPASAQPIDNDAAKLRCEIANALGIAYQNDAHLLSVLTNAIAPSSGIEAADQLRTLKIYWGQLDLERKGYQEKMVQVCDLFGIDKTKQWPERLQEMRELYASGAQAKNELAKLRRSVADSICIEPTGDMELLAACTDLLVTRKIAKDQLHLERSKHEQTKRSLTLMCESNKENHLHIFEMLSILGIDHSEQWATRVHELEQFKKLADDNSKELCRYEHDMEKVCAALGENSASHVDYIIAAIASLKHSADEKNSRIRQILAILRIDHKKEWHEQTIEVNKIYHASRKCPDECATPAARQLTYKVHDDGAYWHVSADMLDDQRFTKSESAIPGHGANLYIKYLEKYFGYKERK